MQIKALKSFSKPLLHDSTGVGFWRTNTVRRWLGT